MFFLVTAMFDGRERGQFECDTAQSCHRGIGCGNGSVRGGAGGGGVSGGRVREDVRQRVGHG